MTVTLNSRAIPESIREEVETALHETTPALLIEWREDPLAQAVLSLDDEVTLSDETLAAIIEGINETVAPIMSSYIAAED